MQIYQPFSRPANQDKRHFPLGTSTARPAEEIWPKKDPEKFRAALVKLLGSESAADLYIARQRPSALIGQQRIHTSLRDAIADAFVHKSISR